MLPRNRNAWSDQGAYDNKAAKLALLFAENFEQFQSEASKQLIKAGPKV